MNQAAVDRMVRIEEKTDNLSRAVKLLDEKIDRLILLLEEEDKEDQTGEEWKNKQPTDFS